MADTAGSNLTDIDETRRRLEAAQGDPHELAVVTLDIVLDGKDPALREAIEAAAVPHWFDGRILAHLVGVDEAAGDALAEALVAHSFVEPFHAHSGWNVHEATRLGLRKRLASGQPERFRELSQRAAEAFEGDDPHFRIERIYHRLVCVPAEASRELNVLWVEWDRASRLDPLDALGTALAELLDTDYVTPTARAQAMLCLGWIRSGRLSIREIEQIADEAASIMREIGNEEGITDALHMKGRALVDRGRLNDAAETFQAVREILQRLLEERPGDTSLLSDLANVSADLGALWRSRGRFTEAQPQLEAALRLRAELAEADPESTRWQYELAVSRVQLGQYLLDRHELDESLRELHEGVDIFERMLADHPDSPDWRRELAVAHNSIGVVLRTQGDLAGAGDHFQMSKDIVESLTRVDPEHLPWRQDVQVSHALIGGLLGLQGRLDASLEHYRTSLDIARELVGTDPDNAGWWDNLASAHSDLGIAYRDLGQLEEALKHNKASRAIAADLVERESDVGVRRSSLAVAAALVGNTLKNIGRLDDALAEYRVALETMQELTGQEPENANWQSQLASFHESVARVLESRGDTDAAFAEYKAAREIIHHQAERQPDNAAWQLRLASACSIEGRLHKEANRLAPALECYRTAKEIADRLATRSPDNTNWQRQLAIAHGDLGSLMLKFFALAATQKVDGVPEPEAFFYQAYGELTAAAEIMVRLSDLDPENSMWKEALSSCRNDLGYALNTMAERIDSVGGIDELPGSETLRERALEQYRLSRSIMAALCELDPANTRWQRMLSIAHFRSGQVLEELGLRTEALAEYEADLAIAERLAKMDPTNARWKKDLEQTRSALARFRTTIDVQEPSANGSASATET